jgi:hypothetical protein
MRDLTCDTDIMLAKTRPACYYSCRITRKEMRLWPRVVARSRLDELPGKHGSPRGRAIFDSVLLAAPGGKSPGQHGGWLGKAYDPFGIVGDPNAPDFRVEDIGLPDGITTD